MRQFNESRGGVWRAAPLVLFILTWWCVSCASTGDQGSDAENDGTEAGDDTSPGGDVDISVCDPSNGPFSLEIDNPYLPFEVGAVHVMEGMEAGEHMSRQEKVVLDETEEVAGVTTRVVQKTSWDDEVLVGVERLFFAQAPDKTVCLFGEEEDIYENDEIVKTDGWTAGEEGALAAVFMPGSPEEGMVFEMFHDEEEIETGEITVVGEPTETPAGTFEDTLTVLEDGPSLKKYARDIGEIYDDGVELISY